MKRIYKAEKINTHGGSIRIYIKKGRKNKVENSIKELLKIRLNRYLQLNFMTEDMLITKLQKNFKTDKILLFFLKTPFSMSSHINLLNCIKKILFFLRWAIWLGLVMASCKCADITFKSSSVVALSFKIFFNH